MMNKKLIFTTAVIIIFAGIGIYFFIDKQSPPASPELPEIKTFEECIRVSIRMEESYPRKCSTAEGKIFTEVGQPTPFEVTTTQQPAIEAISPSSGLTWDKITIHGSGFTMKDNDIAFTIPQTDFQGEETAHLNRVYSPDGKTVSFYLPHELDGCAYSRMKETDMCSGVLIFLPKGAIQISVVNKNGISNKFTFTVK